MSRAWQTMLMMPLLCASSVLRAADKPPVVPESSGINSFAAPFLNEHCLRCHGPDEAKGGLRLSYFLWSTMRDETLFALAHSGELHQPDVLRAQVERMLQHPKAKAFTENFTGQWLSLRDINATTPDKALYPEFEEMLERSSVQETQLFFDELLKENLSVRNFIDSDFAMLNGRLASELFKSK